MVDRLEMYLLVLQEYNKRDNNETNTHEKSNKIKIRYFILFPSFIKLNGWAQVVELVGNTRV